MHFFGICFLFYIMKISAPKGLSFGKSALETFCKILKRKMEENTQENTLSVLKTLRGQTSITIQEFYSSMNVILRHILSQNEL